MTKILTPIDLLEESSWAKALPQAFALAEASGAEITLMTVVPEIAGGLDYRYAIRGERHGSEDLDTEGLVREANERLQQVGRSVAPPGMGFETIARYGTVFEEILAVAEELPADRIVMAAHRPGLAQYMLGDVTARVVRHAPCSVFVVRG